MSDLARSRKTEAPSPIPPPLSAPIPRFARWESVSPLVGTQPTESLVAYPTTVGQCREAIDYCRTQGMTLCPRGSRHSYGDMVLNAAQMLLDTRGMNKVIGFDAETGRMVVEPGVQIIDVFKEAHPQLFTLRASPSEGTITVAGAICNNVNGKDSWKAGNFGDQVLGFKLLTVGGEILEVERERDRQLFEAVVGGMGMLGIIIEATLQLERITTPYLQTSRVEARNVTELLELIESFQRTSDFAVGWLDIYASGANLGRSVMHSTKWLERPERADRYASDVTKTLGRLGRNRHRALFLHSVLNVGISTMLHAQRLTVRAFNKAYFVFCAVRSRMPFVSATELFIEYNFFPNLQIPPAALVCGPRGYTIQVVFPQENAEQALIDLIKACQALPCPPVTVVIRLHRADDNMLSFSANGFSLNFEFHPKARHVVRMRAGINDLVDCAIRHGGRVHLAKDSILTRGQFEKLYPRHGEFLEMKRRLDPEGLLSSNMFRRLFPAVPES